MLIAGMSTTFGNVRGVGDTKYILVYSKKNDTPIAVMSSERRGALRNGLYAMRSTNIPKIAVTTMEIINDGMIEKCAILTEKKPI